VPPSTPTTHIDIAEAPTIGNDQTPFKPVSVIPSMN
jgi:hypothetical protein